MLNVIMLSVVMLNVVMLSVMVLYLRNDCHSLAHYATVNNATKSFIALDTSI